MGGSAFGELLRDCRLLAGWTQEELADRSGVSAHSISVLEAGRRQPRLSSVSRLAEALALDPRRREQLLAAARSIPAPARSAAPETGRPRPGAPCQLPYDTRLFTGRARELDQLLALSRSAPAGSASGMVVISAIDGMGGVGKSALAIRAGHRVRAHFPDGQLFVDLHGHTAGIAPVPSADALDWLLRSLGVPPQQIPDELSTRAALYRERLADTRTLIVLDNAASSAQVRPLLPGTSGCLVLITSRKRLTGLDDAHSLAVDVLPDTDAVALLREGAGPGRVPAGHPAADELVRLCGHLPLAIRIAAARLRHDRGLGLQDLVDRLRDERRRLAHLTDEDRSLRAVFATSFTSVAPDEQDLLRLLGLFPGYDVDICAVAALAGIDPHTAERLLESLLHHNLLVQRTPGRYLFHDLVGLYARSMAADQTRGTDRNAPLHRLAEYYQDAAARANEHLARRTRPGRHREPAAPAVLPALTDRTKALTWMRTEHRNMLALVGHPALSALPAFTVSLSADLAAFLLMEGRWSQAAALHQSAVTAAATAGDRRGEADALCDLGRARHATGDYRAAAELYERALTIHQELGDRHGEANDLHELGRIRLLTGEIQEASWLHEQALAAFRALGDQLGEARALCDLGRARHSSGDSPAAVELTSQVLTLYRTMGDRRGEAAALHDLAYILDEMGDRNSAGEFYQEALTIYEDLNSVQGVANTLRGLGRIRHAVGDHRAAAELHQRSLDACREAGSRHGEADSLLGLGRARDALGEGRDALALYQQALTLYQEIGSRPGETSALLDLAALTERTADPRSALTLHQQALAIARDTRSPLDEARALEGAARCALALGDHAAALIGLEDAVALYRRLGSPTATDAAARLSALRTDPAPAAEGRPPQRSISTWAQSTP
ncbi:ATP-binding protein [Streptomyces monashensis]|uniref:ATP-binding protein n=1 Tax=Streptomyces monashensis TaxID=1678012 RepID=UPI0009A1208D|nr:helix-turn-helix domain-containing protein [Streptomyces monashensis]